MRPEAEPAGAGAGGERRWAGLLVQAWYLLPLALVPWLVAGALAWAWLAASGPWLAPALRGADPGRAFEDLSAALRLLAAVLVAAPSRPELVLALAVGGAVVGIVWLALQILLETLVASSVCLAKDGVAPRFGPVWDRAVDRYDAVFGERLVWQAAGLALLAGAVALAATAWGHESLGARTIGFLTLVSGMPAVWLHLATLLGQAAAVDAPISAGGAVWRGAAMGTTNFLALYFGWIRVGFIASLLTAPFAVPAAYLFVSQPGPATLLAVGLVTVVLTALTSVGMAVYWTVAYLDLARATPAAEAAEAWAVDPEWSPTVK